MDLFEMILWVLAGVMSIGFIVSLLAIIRNTKKDREDARQNMGLGGTPFKDTGLRL